MGDFGQLLRRILREKGLSQARAGVLLGMDQTTVSYYCRLKSAPHRNIIERLASRLDIPVQDLGGEQARGVVRESAVAYPFRSPRELWLAGVKARWKRRAGEKDLELAIRVAFGDDAEAVLKWLNEP